MVIAVFLSVVATVSLARTVRAARYGIISAPAVHYCLYHAGTTIRSRCHIRFFCELNIVHHFLPQTSLSSFLSPSASRSTTVLLPLVPREFEHCCLVVLVDCCLLLVVCNSPHQGRQIRGFKIFLWDSTNNICLYCRLFKKTIFIVIIFLIRCPFRH